MFHLRSETENDYLSIDKIIKEAFLSNSLSNHKEQILVRLLRNEFDYNPDFSIVAESDEQLIGFLKLTKIQIQSTTKRLKALALAPLVVSPVAQGKGVGSALMHEAHKRATDAGFSLIVLVGDPSYYDKFGYFPSEDSGLKLPYDLPKEYCLMKWLTQNTVVFQRGTKVVYPNAFTTYKN